MTTITIDRATVALWLDAAEHELKVAEAHRIKPAASTLDAVREMRSALEQPEQPERTVPKLWCETCEGSGRVYQESQAGCHVEGHHDCPDCDGKGYVESRRYVLAAVLEQPEQPAAEPVALNEAPWAVHDGGRYLEYLGVSPDDVILRLDANWDSDDQRLAFAEAVRDCLNATGQPAAPLTDERIDAIADIVVKGMPDGVRGFMASWGWRQFARALLDDCRNHYRAVPAQPAEPVAWPEGYEPHELPTDYTGKLWIEGQVRALYERTQPAPQQRQPQEFVCSTGLCHYRRPLTDVELDNIAAAQDRGSRHWRKR